MLKCSNGKWRQFGQNSAHASLQIVSLFPVCHHNVLDKRHEENRQNVLALLVMADILYMKHIRGFLTFLAIFCPLMSPT